ncbi:MAG: glycosyltransferase family 4 protein [Planctomycetota bacterium]|nr:glycosyltransferase family 4 protein [Planctomycetota bacterium]
MPATPILHVDAESGFSGGEVQVFHLMRGLRARGWANVLVAPPGSAAAERALAEGFDVEPCAMRSNLDLGAVVRLRGIFKRRLAGAGVVHLHTGRATSLGSKAALGLGAAVVTTRRMDRRVRRGQGTRLLYRRLVDAAVAISGPVGQQLLAAGVPGHKLSVIHSSIDPADVTLPDAALVRERMRAELRLAGGERALLVMARLDKRKAVDVLLRALTLRGAERWRLVVAGEGPEREALVSLAAELGLGERVAFLGQRTDKAELLAAADAFALVSHQEGLGVAALEAMGAGKAVVASRVGGLAEAVVDEVTGLFVEPGDVEGLGAVLARLGSEPGLLERLGAAGPARIAEAYHVDGMVAAYDALYRRLLTARTAG